MDSAEILLTLEPLTFLCDEDDHGVFSAMEMSSRKRLGLLHYRSEKDIEEELRKVLAKIGKRVSHGAKDQATRREVLATIADNAEYVRNLLRVCEDGGDPAAVCSCFLVLRECVAAKSTWRPANLARMIDFGATEILANAAVNAFQRQALSEVGAVALFWTLSALATKDSKFSLRLSSCGALKVMNPILTRLASKSQLGLYPVLQVVKAASRNHAASALLGKEGVVDTILQVVRPFAKKNYCPKLKAALEALAVLTRPGPNVTMLAQVECCRTLLGIFARYEEFLDQGRLANKIAGSLLTLFLRLVSTVQGRDQFVSLGGIQTVRIFCHSSKASETKKWDRLLCRASAVISRCCEKMRLPVGSDISPLQFLIPDGAEENKKRNADFSTSTSRETTPESEFDEGDDDEEDDDSEDDEDDVFAETDVENASVSPSSLRRNKSIDSNQRSTGAVTAARKPDDLRDQYESIFLEYLQEDKQKATRNMFKKDDTFLRHSGKVRGLVPFCKSSYPDMISAEGLRSAGLKEKDKRVYREKILGNLDKLLHSAFETSAASQAVFDIDDLTSCNQRGKERGEFCSRPLSFESRFESGNLRKAIRTGEREYDLVLTPDVNTANYHQWFYFEVSGMEAGAGQKYIFNVINYEKANSQYNYGMQPLLFSEKEALQNNMPQWIRAGTDILYYKNRFARSQPHSKGAKTKDDNREEDSNTFMTASFTIEFPHEEDVCYLAYHYPYTYSKLLNDLEDLQSKCDSETLFRVDNLTPTVTGQHGVPLITITSSASVDNSIPMVKRKLVFLTARVHPGETNSSWIMKGLMDYLVSSDITAKDACARIVFKIVPMLNVEGVINGCHRCGLTGEDLNRRWLSPSPVLHPEIYHTKAVVEYAAKVLKIKPFLFCDLHGHSRKKNVFVYGCSPHLSWLPSDVKSTERGRRNSEQDFESSLSHTVPMFDRKSCRYTVEKSRESTARVVVWREFGVRRSFTLESTFCGANKGRASGLQVTTAHMTETGEGLARAILESVPGGGRNANKRCAGGMVSVVRGENDDKIRSLIVTVPEI